MVAPLEDEDGNLTIGDDPGNMYDTNETVDSVGGNNAVYDELCE